MSEIVLTQYTQQLFASDLRSDPILVRKIRRMQRADLEESQFDSDGEDGEDDDDEVKIPQSSQMSARDNSKIHAPSTQQPSQSSIVEDSGNLSDEDDE